MPIYGGQRIVDITADVDMDQTNSYLASITVAMGSVAESNQDMVAPTASIAHFTESTEAVCSSIQESYQTNLASMLNSAYLRVGPCYLYAIINGHRQTGIVSVQEGDLVTFALFNLQEMVGYYDFHGMYFDDLRFGAGGVAVPGGSGMTFLFRR